MNLHPSQQEAVTWGLGPVFVLAGPGSGKTTVLTNRIRYLIRSLSIPPERILVMTFTKAAALEMQQRFRRMEPGAGVIFGTFHSVFYHILKESIPGKRFQILSGSRREAMVERLLKASGREQLLEREFLRELLRELSRLKQLKEPDFSISCLLPPAQLERLYRGYEAWRVQEGLLDFDDILLQCRQLFREEPMLERWQKRFSCLLIDEFQDVSDLQYELVRLLAGPENRLFVVGDDDQAIYGFRGAAPELMKRAAGEMKEGKVLRLEVNYRSAEPVIAAAGRLIGHNRKRFSKEIVGVGRAGEPIGFFEFEDPGAQAEGAVRYLTERKERDPGETAAILLRTNRLMKPFGAAFLKSGLPFYCKGGSLFDEPHWAEPDLIAYLKLAAGLGDRGELLRILNRPYRSLSRESLRPEGPPASEREAWELFQKQLSLLGGLPPFGALHFLRKGLGYEAWGIEQCRQQGEDRKEFLRQLDEFQKKSGEFRTIRAFLKALEEEKSSLRKFSERPEPGSILLLTIHGAKGLEFDTVLLPDWNEGILPYQGGALKTFRRELLEEERRLAYVAVTRAKSRLWVSWVRNRYGKPQRPSLFVGELQGR